MTTTDRLLAGLVVVLLVALYVAIWGAFGGPPLVRF